MPKKLRHKMTLLKILISISALGCFPPTGCSGQFLAKWWRRRPYIELDEKTAKKAEGLFRDILTLIVTEICENCSQIYFEPPLNTSMEVEMSVENNITDFGCPMYGSKEQEKFRGYPFIPIGKFQ